MPTPDCRDLADPDDFDRLLAEVEAADARAVEAALHATEDPDNLDRLLAEVKAADARAVEAALHATEEEEAILPSLLDTADHDGAS